MTNLPFLPFLLSPFVLDFPIHTFDDELLRCQDLSCLSMADAKELTCQCKCGKKAEEQEEEQMGAMTKLPVLSWTL